MAARWRRKGENFEATRKVAEEGMLYIYGVTGSSLSHKNNANYYILTMVRQPSATVFSRPTVLRKNSILKFTLCY